MNDASSTIFQERHGGPTRTAFTDDSADTDYNRVFNTLYIGRDVRGDDGSPKFSTLEVKLGQQCLVPVGLNSWKRNDLTTTSRRVQALIVGG